MAGPVNGIITGRMTGGNIITARIITGCIITGRAPKLINDGDKIDILNLAGRLYEKTRLSKKEEFEFTCEDLKPKCVEGNVEKAECKKDQSTKRLYFDISVKDCKEIIDEQKGDYIISTGYAKGYVESSTKFSQNSFNANIISFIEQGELLIREFRNNKETNRVKTKSSGYKIELNIGFTSGEKDIELKTGTKLSGSYSVNDEIGNKMEDYSFSDFAVELVIIASNSGGEQQVDLQNIQIYVSINGSYSLDTTPDVDCIEGVFSFKTIKPIKSGGEGQGYCGIESGEIEVNNAKIEFSSGKVKVSVDNQQKEYGCEEVEGLCKYEPIKMPQIEIIEEIIEEGGEEIGACPEGNVCGYASTFAKTIGGSNDDVAWSIIQSSDGGYVVAGLTYSFGAGGWDFYVVKMDANGNVCFSQNITNYSVSSNVGSFSSPSPVSSTQFPTVSTVYPTISSGGSVSDVCALASAPHLCSGSQDCGFSSAIASREKEDVKSYGCSAGGVLSRFLIPASGLIVYGWLRKKRKKKKVF